MTAFKSKAAAILLVVASLGLASWALVHLMLSGSQPGLPGGTGTEGWPLSSARRLGGPTAEQQQDSGNIGGANDTALVANSSPALRLALLRPFAPHNAADLMTSFDDWRKLCPCDLSRQSGLDLDVVASDPTDSGARTFYDVDLFLSISQKMSPYPDVMQMVDSIKNDAHDVPWGKCFDSIHVLEADIPPSLDRYGFSSSSQVDPLWVNGPNVQFLRSLRQIKALSPRYDAVLIMEADTFPWTDSWLDRIVKDVLDKRPFSLLGSKHHGITWNQTSNKMPPALAQYVNGNAVYNITDPFFNLLLTELEAEHATTMYRVIPYDYRISQIVHEASFGTKPVFPFDEMKDDEGKSIVLPDKTNKFQSWWQDVVRGGREDSIIKESTAIENFAATNFLPCQVSSSAAIVHGKLLREELKDSVSLVLYESSQSDTQRFLDELKFIEHPFSEVVLLLQKSSSSTSKPFGSTYKSNVPLVIYDLHTSMNSCNAPVSGNWFLSAAASSHFASNRINLPVSRHPSSKPVVPFVLADVGSESSGTKLVLDNELVFHRDLFSTFCQYSEDLSTMDEARAIATSFIAYLNMLGVASDIYTFSDRALHGSFVNFIDDTLYADDDRKAQGQSLAIQRALQAIGDSQADERHKHYPGSEQSEDSKKSKRSKSGKKRRRGLHDRRLMPGFPDIKMQHVSRKAPAIDVSFHVFQVAKPDDVDTGAVLLNCILQGLLEPNELYSFIPRADSAVDAESFGPWPDDISDDYIDNTVLPFVSYNGTVHKSRDFVGKTLVSQTFETNIDLLTRSFGDLFTRNIYVAANRKDKGLAIEEKYCKRTNVVCIGMDEYAFSDDEGLVQGVEKVASILKTKIPLFTRLDMDTESAVDRVKLMEDASAVMKDLPFTARDPIFGIRGGRLKKDLMLQDDAIAPFHIFQIAKPHTGSTLVNCILQGLFDDASASYSFLPKRTPAADDLRFGPYPEGIDDAVIAEIDLPFIVHEGKLKTSREHLADTTVTKTHVVDVDLLSSTFGEYFHQVYFVAANRAEKGISIKDEYCLYSNVICIDYEVFAYKPDESTLKEITDIVKRVKQEIVGNFPLLDEAEMNVDRAVDRVKRMEQATEEMATKTFDAVEYVFGIHGGHRNRADKPLRGTNEGADKSTASSAEKEAGANATSLIPHLVHPSSPYAVQECDEQFCPYDQDQSIALASMQRARDHATMASVTLASTVLSEESGIAPASFLRLDDLFRSTKSEYPHIISQKKLPFVADIFDALKKSIDYPSFDYVIYTNADIILNEEFYNIVAVAINHGYDAFTINRQTIPKARQDGTLYTASDLDTIYTLEGEEHPGSDCFVIKKSIFDKIALGDLFLGYPPFASFILLQIQALADNYRMFASNELKATFHLGDDQEWRHEDKTNAEMYNLQYHHALVDLLPLWSSFCLFDWRADSGNSESCTRMVKKFRKYAKTHIDGGIDTIEKMYDSRKANVSSSEYKDVAPGDNVHVGPLASGAHESSSDEPKRDHIRARQSNPSRAATEEPSVAFQFLIGVEGTGHHLARSLYLNSPVHERLTSYGINDDVTKLSLSLWNRHNPADGIWSAPCATVAKDNDAWWKEEEGGPEGGVLFDTLVSRLQAIAEKIEQGMKNDASLPPGHDPLVVAVNAGAAGNVKGQKPAQVSPFMSYPMLGGPCRALQYPNIDVLYQACTAAGVWCQHAAVYRDPYRVLRSTTMNRSFASRHVQLATLLTMQHVVFSQMMAHRDRLVACWEADANVSEGAGDIGRLLGWTDEKAFKDAFQDMFIVPSPITDEDRRAITKDDDLKVYMVGLVEGNDLIKRTCQEQLEVNRRARIL